MTDRPHPTARTRTRDGFAGVLLISSAIILGAFAGIYFTKQHARLVFLDNVHWTVAYTAAAALAWIGVRTADAASRPVRRWFAWGLSAYALGQVLWDVQVATGWNPFPGPSDLFFVALGPCCALGLLAALRANTGRSQVRTAALDTSALSVAVLAVTLALYLPRRGDTGAWPLTVMVAYPLGLLTAACIGVILVPTLRLRADRGWLVFLGGLMVNGWLWMQWNSLTLDHALQDGTVYNATFSVAALAMGFGARFWRVTPSDDRVWERRCEGFLRLLPLLVVMCAGVAVVLAWTVPDVPQVVRFSIGAGAVVVVALAVARQSVLLTERERFLEAERLASESEVKFKTLFETAQDAIFIMDDRVFVDCNPSALKLFGGEKAQLVGHSPAEYSPEMQPDGRPSADKARELIAAALDGQPQFFEWEHRRLDGVRFDTEVRLNRFERGAGFFLQATVRDITERKRGQAALKQSEERFSRIFASCPIPIALIKRADLSFLDANESFFQMSGFTREEVIGRTSLDLNLYPDPERREFIVNHVREHGHLHAHEQPLRTKSGQVRPHILWFDAISIGGEECVLAIGLDITEQKELEARFLRAQRMESIGTLASGLAHDLNNILSPIMMSVPILRFGLSGEQREQIVSTIELSAARGAQIVRQVLTFGRGLGSEKCPLQASALIAEMLKIMRQTFPKNIVIQSSVDPDLWPVIGDATQLHQVLLNLCVNARDAMPEGGTLRLSAGNVDLDGDASSVFPEVTPGPHVLLEATDTGAGIPPELVERIFDPFFTTKEVGKGTGLGLSTVAGIVKSHRGFLRVCSAEGKGTTFKVYLPAQSEPCVDMAAKSAAEMPCGDGELILVVDDEASVREITQRALEAYGYRVVLAEDGAEAVSAYTTHGGEIAAVLTDMSMPVRDGTATIRALRAMNPDLRIIAASGLSADGNVAHAADLGVKHFLPKPYTAETLLKVLKQILAENGTGG